MSASTPAVHPARVVAFGALFDGLEAARALGLVYRRDQPDGRALYCYTSRCVYENAWDEMTVLARGLILHPAARRVVATPFPKFFNTGESGRSIPDLPFEAFEKLDGSLAIIHHHAGRWRAATKGAFDSSQAAWAEARLAAQDTSALTPGTTYLAEAVYPENRIVIRYPEAALVLLSAFGEDGAELGRDELLDVASRLGWRTARQHTYASFGAMLADAHALPATAEGFVARFADGMRLKIKGAEYRRIHALISRCTPLAMWEAMAAGDDLAAMRRDIPEEFWTDFDAIIGLLGAELSALEARVAAAAASVAHLSDKELGLSLADLPGDIRTLVFPWRKSGGRLQGKPMQSLLRLLRPTGNVLAGYKPSYAMGRLLDESA